MKKGKISLFLLALFISLLIWIGIKLTRLQTETLDVEISVKNTPTGIIPTLMEPESFHLVVEGKGMNLLKLNFDKLSYYIDLKNTHYGKNYIPLRLGDLLFIKKRHLDIIQKPELRNILVVMDNMTSKSLRIRPTFSDKESKEFFDKNLLALEPAEVTIKGPKKFLADLYEVTTHPFNKKKHAKGTTIKLDKPENDLISTDIDEVKIVKLKSKIASKTFVNVPITHPDSIKIFPEFATIKLSAKTGKLDTISTNDLKVYVDVTGLKGSKNLSVKVELLPDVKLLDQIPEKVRIQE